MIYKHWYNSGHFLWSSSAVDWVLTVLVADIYVSVQALEACQTGASENIHEDGSHHEADNENDSSWRKWVIDFFELINVGDDHVADESVSKSNSESTEKINQGADTISDEESSGVLKGKDEGSEGGWTETVTGKSNLDVGVLVDEFDKSVEAIEAASDAAGNDLDNGVLWVSLFHLLIDEFEGNPDDPNDSKDERAKGKRSKIVSEGPPKSSGDGKTASGLACGGKVPSADAANKDVGEHGLQELADPEEGENVHVGHIFLFLAETDALHLGASLWLSNFSRTEKVSEVV